MATTAPIDVERYLLEGELLEASRGPKPLPKTTKPPLEEALGYTYIGQLPEPVPQPPPEPGILQKTGEAISSAAGAAARIPGQIYESLPSITAPSGPDVTTTIPPRTPATPTQPAITPSPAAPIPERQYAPGLYGTLQRSTNFVRDVSEAAGKTLAQMGAAGFGAATAVSDILNSYLAAFARGGPLPSREQGTTHYGRIFNEMDKTIQSLSPEPRSDIAKNVNKAVGAVANLVKNVAELPGRGLVATGLLDEDTAKLLGFATELYLFYRLDRGVREVAPELRAKISEFKTRMSKARTDTEAAGVAQDLADAAAKNPRLDRALDEARGKFRDEADNAGATGPRQPSPEGGPAGGGAAAQVDYTPAELQKYQADLQRATEQFRAAHPEGFTIDQLRTYLDENVTKPQGTPRPAPEAPRPTAEPTRPQPQAAPTEAPRAAPTAERPVQPEIVVGQETAVAPVTRPAEPPAPRQRIMDAYPRLQDSDPAVRRAALEEIRNSTVIGESLEGSLARWGISPQISSNILTLANRIDNEQPQAAATVAPETVPAPVSPETPAVAAVPEQVITPPILNAPPAAERAHELYRAANAMGVSDKDYVAMLAELKGLAREGLKSNQSIRIGLERLGFAPEDVKILETQLRKVRASKAGTETLQQVAEKPAVQQAATEAVLETAPAGTEVEIPAPAEPVVDTTPVVEKPKRKRRVVKAPEELAAERAPFERQHTTAATDARYYTPANLDDLGATARVGKSAGEPLESTEMVKHPVQLRFPGSQLQGTGFGRAIEGAKPDAIFIDTAGLSTRTPLADIERQVASRRMSPDVAEAMRANLQRQSELFFQPIEQAHRYTGEELTRLATQIAAETGIDLYVKKGKNYELVPKDVVRTDARLNRGDNLQPTPISSDAAGAYAESKTSPIGPDQIREITNAIEQGIDVTDRLPSELVPHYQQMRANERAGIDESERRAFIDILNDLNTMLGEQGAIGGNWSREARMAAQRLQADMRKAGKDVREFLFGARPEDVAQFEAYLDRINNPVPPNSTNPRNMRFDPENIIPGDRVVKQRVQGDNNFVPLWNSEVKGLQNARDIKPGGGRWDIKLPLRQHKAAGTEFLYYAYRTAQKNLNAELNVLHQDMQELGRGFSSRSLENIGANGYQRQGGDGQRILTYNKVTPQPLTPAERRLQATIDGIYAVTWDRLNETRAATGRDILPRVDDYQTFARTISLLNRLGIKVDLARDTVAEINAKYIHHKSTNFPYVVRKHAFYTAEMNALKILDTYMQSALHDIHMSPFIAKMHELIETNLPDPVTGKETWALKKEKPGLYNELRRWTDFLATGTNVDISATERVILQTLNNNIAYATLSGLLRSAGIQVSTLVNTSQAFGRINTIKGVLANFGDFLTGSKQRQFALDNSEILSSRKFIDAYDQVTSAIIGRRPRDFFHAIRTGDISSIQQAVGRPGFKLMELFDMEAARVTWNIAYKQARSQAMNYSHKDAVRFADDAVVRTQGSTMPGDLAGVQRNAEGKLITQFQTFLISDWNFLRHEVLTKGKIGGGGGGQIPPGGVPSGSGSWEDPKASRSNYQMAKNIIGFLIATQLVNELYKMLHIQPAQPDPVEDVRRGMKQQHGPLMLAWDVAVGQTERIPFLGGMRYGKGLTGPALEIARDLARAGRVDPLVSNPYKKQMEALGLPKDVGGLIEPGGTLFGVPYLRQTTKYAKAQVRGENIWDSLMGWYSENLPRGGRRERGERRERASR